MSNTKPAPETQIKVGDWVRFKSASSEYLLFRVDRLHHGQAHLTGDNDGPRCMVPVEMLAFADNPVSRVEHANACIAELNADLTEVREELDRVKRERDSLLLSLERMGMQRVRLRGVLAIYADVDNWGKWQTKGGDFFLLIPGDNDYEYGGQLAHEALTLTDSEG